MLVTFLYWHFQLKLVTDKVNFDIISRFMLSILQFCELNTNKIWNWLKEELVPSPEAGMIVSYQYL